MGRKQTNPETRAQQVSVSLPAYLVKMIDDYCKKHRLKRSAVISVALEIFMGVGTDGEEGPHKFRIDANTNWPPR